MECKIHNTKLIYDKFRDTFLCLKCGGWEENRVEDEKRWYCKEKTETKETHVRL